MISFILNHPTIKEYFAGAHVQWTFNLKNPPGEAESLSVWKVSEEMSPQDHRKKEVRPRWTSHIDNWTGSNCKLQVPLPRFNWGCRRRTCHTLTSDLCSPTDEPSWWTLSWESKRQLPWALRLIKQLIELNKVFSGRCRIFQRRFPEKAHFRSKPCFFIMFLETTTLFSLCCKADCNGIHVTPHLVAGDEVTSQQALTAGYRN